MGPVTFFILLVLLLWSVVKVIVSVIVRACTIYRARVMGLWILGAFWSLPFQLIISPVRWANEAATEVVDRVVVEMESQAHMDSEKRGCQDILRQCCVRWGEATAFTRLMCPGWALRQKTPFEAVKKKLQSMYIL
jgi:hypothetical protein